MNWDTICSPLESVCLKIINLHHENDAYLLKLLGTLLIATDLGLFS